MVDPQSSPVSRRNLLKSTGAAAIAGTVGRLVLPRAYAAEDNTLQIALIGTGGRGTGAAGDAMNS